MITNHVCRAQLLEYDSAVLVHQFAAFFMQKVGSLVANMSVRFPDGMFSSTSSVTTTLTPRKSLLSGSQLVQRMAQVAWVLIFCPLERKAKAVKPKSMPTALSEQAMGYLSLNREAPIPMQSFPLDSDSFHFAPNRTVQFHLARQAQDSANLRECASGVLQGPTQLRIGEGYRTNQPL